MIWTMQDALSNMERSKIEEMKTLYTEHQKLHTVGDIMNIPWQTVYWWLKKEGVSVTGNKSWYGGENNQIALIGEDLFRSVAPNAVNQNDLMFQPKYDYTLGNLKIEIKTAFLRDGKSRSNKVNLRWAFNTKKQQEADYIICYCLSGHISSYNVDRILLIPREFITDIQTVSVSPRKSKWLDFETTKKDLADFLKY
jgi:hypothetical protein